MTEITLKKIVGSIIVCSVFFVIVYVAGTKEAEAGNKKDKWEIRHEGKVVNISSVYGNDWGFAFWFEDGYLEGFWHKYWEGSFPAIGKLGTIYVVKEGEKTIRYKWVETEEKPESKTKIKKSTEFKITPILTTPSWEQTFRKLPPYNKTVLVRYKNEVTITTAYVNSKKEWKLETERETYKGGKTIDTIKEWREILK